MTIEFILRWMIVLTMMLMAFVVLTSSSFRGELTRVDSKQVATCAESKQVKVVVGAC